MILARLALRNLLRQRRRTGLTLMVVVAGFLALSLAGGLAGRRRLAWALAGVLAAPAAATEPADANGP